MTLRFHIPIAAPRVGDSLAPTSDRRPQAPEAIAGHSPPSAARSPRPRPMAPYHRREPQRRVSAQRWLALLVAALVFWLIWACLVGNANSIASSNLDPPPIVDAGGADSGDGG